MVTDPANVVAGVAREREWQAGRLPEEIMGRIVVLERGGGVVVKLRKGEGF